MESEGGNYKMTTASRLQPPASSVCDSWKVGPAALVGNLHAKPGRAHVDLRQRGPKHDVTFFFFFFFQCLGDFVLRSRIISAIII